MICWENFRFPKGVQFQIHGMLFEVIDQTLLLVEGQSLELHKR